MKRLANLWPYPLEMSWSGTFDSPRYVRLHGQIDYPDLKEDLQDIAGLVLSDADSALPLRICLDPTVAGAETYLLEVAASGILIRASDRRGLMYGIQTLLQVLGLFRGTGRWPALRISDRPAYRKRCFMADMGRSVYPLPMLRRLVRILWRLKMNQLHLHLYDDELCGIRFQGLPFGSENPYAMTVAELGELARYAAAYGVEIVPELESWGHVGSIVYHRPGLRGGDRMYGTGSSYLICEKTFDLVREMVEQVAAVLPDEATIHLGLDEAQWFLHPSMPPGFSPEDLVQRCHDIVQEVGRRLGKRLTLRIWADHGGRAVPPAAQENTIIEPWQYWNTNRDLIDKRFEAFSGEGKMRWMMGAGQSANQFRGAYHATRYWCQKGLSSPNVEGVNITFWECNNLDRNLVTLFVGAQFAWNPRTPISRLHSEDYEVADKEVFPRMRWWQAHIPEGHAQGLVQDKGPEVHRGFYVWGERHDEPVAPTVPAARTREDHDQVNEGRT